MNENELTSKDEINVGYEIDKPTLYNTEVNEIVLDYLIDPPIPNDGYSTVEIHIRYRITNINNEVILQLKSRQLFEIKNLRDNEQGHVVIINAIKQSYTDLYNKIYDRRISGVIMNQISSHFTSASHSLLNSATDIGYVFSSLDLGS